MISQPARIVRCSLLLAISAAGVSACSWEQAATISDRPAEPAVVYEARRLPASSVGQQAAAVAARQIGIPYRYGGSTPHGFDCSGLVHYAYRRAGKAIPRTTAQLWAGTDPVNRRDIQVGDLLFFRIDGKMSHVGMYLGNNRFVHAPSTGKVVSIANLSSDYYRKAFIRARRPK